MPLESPHCLSGPCEAGLNFVGDEEPSLRPNGFDGSAQEARRIGQDSIAGEDSVADKSRDPHTLAPQVRNGNTYLGCELGADIARFAAVKIRRGHGSHEGAARNIRPSDGDSFDTASVIP
jgi:hypothetical protein